MGSGKSTVGRLLAATMGFRFIDLDRRIEKTAGSSIARLFELEGEAGFRKIERRLLRRTLSESGVVVATGGGVMTSAANRELLAAHGTTVWLNPDFETLARRVAAQPAGQRPLFRDPAQAKELFESRRAGYEEADLRVDVGAVESAGAVAERVARLLGGKPCAT